MWVVYNVSLNMRFVYNCRVHCVKFIRGAAEKHNNEFHFIFAEEKENRSDLIVGNNLVDRQPDI